LDENGDVILEECVETTHSKQQDVATITNQSAYAQKLLEVYKLHARQRYMSLHRPQGVCIVLIKHSFL
jgi:hypothetical protein